MKAILISIRPKWVAKILNGEKTIEVRKGTALYKAIQKLIDEYGYADIYVYCSKINKKHYHLIESIDTDTGKTDYEIDYYIGGGNYLDWCFDGKVAFKFRCYKVEKIDRDYVYDFSINDVVKDWFKTNSLQDKELYEKSCLTKNEIYKYLKPYARICKGCAIHISDLEVFDKPKELSEFRKPYYCDCKLRCEDNLKPSFCREHCQHNLDRERLSVCCDRDGWVKEWNNETNCLTKAPQSWCYIESEKLNAEY